MAPKPEFEAIVRRHGAARVADVIDEATDPSDAFVLGVRPGGAYVVDRYLDFRDEIPTVLTGRYRHLLAAILIYEAGGVRWGATADPGRGGHGTSLARSVGRRINECTATAGPIRQTARAELRAGLPAAARVVGAFLDDMRKHADA